MHRKARAVSSEDSHTQHENDNRGLLKAENRRFCTLCVFIAVGLGMLGLFIHQDIRSSFNSCQQQLSVSEQQLKVSKCWYTCQFVVLSTYTQIH